MTLQAVPARLVAKNVLIRRIMSQYYNHN